MARLVKCKTCGNMLARNAKICPQCGAKHKHFGCCGGALIILVAIIAISVIVGRGNSRSASYQQDVEVCNSDSIVTSQKADSSAVAKEIVEKSLFYLKDVTEIDKVIVVSEDKVYLVLKTPSLPEDYDMICNGAAFNASTALKKKNISDACTVYLLPAGGATKNEARIVYEAYAKNGKVQRSGDTPYGEHLKMQKMTPAQKKAFLLDKKAKENAAIFEKKYVSSWNGSVKPVVQYVKQSMHNPDSFRHVNTQWWYIEGTTDRYLVKMTFRGTNAFNVVVTNVVEVEVDLNGNVCSR